MKPLWAIELGQSLRGSMPPVFDPFRLRLSVRRLGYIVRVAFPSTVLPPGRRTDGRSASASTGIFCLFRFGERLRARRYRETSSGDRSRDLGRGRALGEWSSEVFALL